MQQPSVEEARRQEAPPLAHQDRRAQLGPEVNQRPAIDVDPAPLARAHTIEGGRGEEPEVHQQNHGCGEMGVRYETGNLPRRPPVDGSRADFGFAVRANTVV